MSLDRRYLNRIALTALLTGLLVLAVWLLWPGSANPPAEPLASPGSSALPGSSAAQGGAVDDTSLRPMLLARNTALLVCGAGLLALPLGTLLAVLLARTDVPLRRTAIVLLVLMLFMPLYLQVAAWESGFGRIGWLSLVRQSLQSPLLSGWRGAIWVHGLAATPWVALIVGVGLRFVEPELEEEALIEGSAAQVFFRVTLRRAIAAMAVAALWITVTVAGEMTVTNIYVVRTYAEELYTGLALGDTLAQSFRNALPGMVVLLCLTIAALSLAAALAPPHRQSPVRRPWTFRLGRWRWPAAAVVAVAVLLIAGLPLANLIIKAGYLVRQVDGHYQRTWSLAQLLQMLADCPREYGSDLAGSLLLGSVSSLAVMGIATPLAWSARRGGWRAAPALLIMATCLSAPGPLIALAISWLLSAPFTPEWLYSRSILPPVLALTVRALPLTMLICWFALRSVSDETLEAAAAEGIGRWSRFFYIAAPQRTAALGAAWLIAFALTLGDPLASVLTVLPPNFDLASLRIFGLVHFGVEQKVAGLCLVSAACFATIGLAVLWLLTPRERSASRE